MEEAAHREGIGYQRQVDQRVDVAAVITAAGVGVTGIDVAFGDVELRLVGDVTQHPGLCAGAEQRALRSFENLDALAVCGVDVQTPAAPFAGLILPSDGNACS